MLSKSIMFMARDRHNHTLCYGPVAKAWMIENRNGLVRMKPNLIQGLSELERVSGIPSNYFEVEDNPYYDTVALKAVGE